MIVGIDGAMGSTFKTLLHTRDGGRHWEIDPASERVVGSEAAPIHMIFVSQLEGWIVTAGVNGQPAAGISLAHTTDGGKSWRFARKFIDPRVCGANCSVEDVSPVYLKAGNSQEAFFFVPFAYAPTQSVPVYYTAARYRTHDGGASWSAPETFRPPGSHWTFADFEFGAAQEWVSIFPDG